MMMNVNGLTAELKFVGLPIRQILHSLGFSISRPGDLDLWPLTLKQSRIIARGMDNFLPISVFLKGFVLDLSANTCQIHHLTLRPWPLTLEDMALAGDGSLYSICLPTFKFVRLLVQKMLRIYCVSINRPCDLDLWPFDLYIGLQVIRVTGFHSANFGLPFHSFHSRVRLRHAIDGQTSPALIL